MSLNKHQVELFCSFVARHKRFLKLRETSFNSKQLDFGTKVCEKAVKSVQAACKVVGLPLHECLAKPAKKAKLIKELRKKVPRLTPKQATFIIENFDAFQSAVTLSQQPIGTKNAKQVSEYGDKYYQPIQHNYR